METKKRMVIDLLSGGSGDCVHTVQGDAYSRVVELELKAGRQNWPVPEDTSVLVEYVKSDGAKGVYDTLPDGSAAWSAEGNVLSLTLAPQMLTVSGTVTAQVRLIQGERLLSLFAFRIYVHNKLAGGGTSEDYFSWRAQYLPQTLGAAVGQWMKAAQVDGQGRVLAVETADAPDGGYYTPGVTQPDSSTMEVAFAPSDEAMPALPPVRVTLPPGPQGEPGIAPPLVLNAEVDYTADSAKGDEALEAIIRNRQILVRVPNADGGKFTAIYSPILTYQIPNYANNYLYLFYLRDEKQDLSSTLGVDIKVPVYGELKMLLSKTYNESPLVNPQDHLSDTLVYLKGKTPQKGVDYYTEADKTEMVNAVIAALPVYDGEVEAV